MAEKKPEKKPEAKKQEKPTEKVKAEKQEPKKTEEKADSKSTIEQLKQKIEAKKDQAAPKKGEKKEAKSELEREYIIPLRRKLVKKQRYKRANKAVRIIKEFLAKHMKVEDRDIRKVKLDMFLNNEIWFRGIKKPPAKIKVKATKFDDGIVRAELVDIPEEVKYAMERYNKADKEAEKPRAKAAVQEKEAQTEGEKTETKEKATAEAGLEKQKQEAKQAKHTTQAKVTQPKRQIRKALKR